MCSTRFPMQPECPLIQTARPKCRKLTPSVWVFPAAPNGEEGMDLLDSAVEELYMSSRLYR